MTSDQQIPEPQKHEPGSHTPEHHAPEHHEPEPGPERSGATRRPLGFWLKLVDRRISDEIERVLSDDDLTRRDWRTLNLLAGTAHDEHLAAKIAAKPGLVHRLAERGWVEGTPPRLTDAGREALDALTERVDAVRARVAGTVSPEEFATTVATLEAIARELGWDESQPLPRGRRGGRGFGRRRGGFGRFGFGGPHGFGPAGFDPRERHEHGEFDRHAHGGWHGHDPHEHGAWHGKGRRGHGERFGREHCAPGADMGGRERHGFGARPGARHADVHVHVHLHGDRRGRKHPHADA